MSERISMADKMPEVKSKNSVPHIQKKTDSSQSMNSPVDRVLFLQRTIGNQAIAKLIKSGTLQTKLRVGQPGDVYEQEADRVADQVMRMPDISRQTADSRIQRKCPKCEEELPAKETLGDAPEVTPRIEADISLMRGGGQPLPESVRAFMEPRFGHDFSDVRVHTDAKAAESAEAVNAQAYTVGQDVVFGAGQYVPEKVEGIRLLAHELMHVVQQRVYGIKGHQAQHDCRYKDSDEAKWADQNPGKVLESKEPSPGSPHPITEEIILWNFCFSEAKLRPRHEESLKEASQKWSKLLITRRDLRIKVVGAASSTGDPATNEMVAISRANAVKLFLSEHNIPAQLIDVEGIGSRIPLADENPTSPPENKARNRRVEVFFYVPTRLVGGFGPTVDAHVTDLKIGNGKIPSNLVDAFFDPNNNLFARHGVMMEASAKVTLTSLLTGASIGFLQFLVADDRWAAYKSKVDGSTLVLDYDRCVSSFVPCRDVDRASNLFSVDEWCLIQPNPGTDEKTIRLADLPGTAYPLQYPHPKDGPFVLMNYGWGMVFVVILGVRAFGNLFMPLNHVWWSLAASEGIDVPAKKTTGPKPLAMFGTWEHGGPSGFPFEAAMAGKTCKLATRSIEIIPEEHPCRPSERR